tara:strand:- start:2257 stop:2556 length:300 start_codon:yes stop_codon:yes gene_type:complete
MCSLFGSGDWVDTWNTTLIVGEELIHEYEEPVVVQRDPHDLCSVGVDRRYSFDASGIEGHKSVFKRSGMDPIDWVAPRILVCIASNLHGLKVVGNLGQG